MSEPFILNSIHCLGSICLTHTHFQSMHVCCISPVSKSQTFSVLYLISNTHGSLTLGRGKKGMKSDTINNKWATRNKVSSREDHKLLVVWKLWQDWFNSSFVHLWLEFELCLFPVSVQHEQFTILSCNKQIGVILLHLSTGILAHSLWANCSNWRSGLKGSFSWPCLNSNLRTVQSHVLNHSWTF